MTFHIPAVDPALPPLPEMLTASFSAPGLFPPAPPARHEVPEHGSWLQTASGRAFDLLNPSPADVDFDDISLALSRVPRFGGHTRRPYSVAQHSVLVAELLESAGHPGHVVLQGLLHDATEAYVMDLPRPLKDLVPEYKTIENRVWRAVAMYFDLPVHLDPVVKEADALALALEARTLLPCPPAFNVACVEGVVVPPVLWQPMKPCEARRAFTLMCARLLTRNMPRGAEGHHPDAALLNADPADLCGAQAGVGA